MLHSIMTGSWGGYISPPPLQGLPGLRAPTLGLRECEPDGRSACGPSRPVHYVRSSRARPAASRRGAGRRTVADLLHRFFLQKHSDPCPLLSSIHTLPTMNGLMCILSVHVRTTFSYSESTGSIHSHWVPAAADRHTDQIRRRPPLLHSQLGWPSTTVKPRNWCILAKKV